MSAPGKLRQAVHTLRSGGVIAYPTEAVYGLGCDPLNQQAVLRLLQLKQRPWEKGLILIAADFAQITPYILPLGASDRARVMADWPGPITWVLPARPDAPAWLRGTHTSIAVRVTAHPQSAALCRAFGGAIVSTSANPAGLAPARNALQVRKLFGDGVDLILHGALGGRSRPSEIRDLRSGVILRR